MSRTRLTSARRWVIKIGSALLTARGAGLDRAAIRAWVDEIAALCRSGHEVVLVSSGAVAEGIQRLGWERRPRALFQLQAAAAVGQMGLVGEYESAFQRHDMRTAQVLLTHEDLSDRTRYLNARSTLRALLDLGVVPVVNENDSVVTDEIRFGDNDTLAALVANLVEAEVLVILTDVGGLYPRPPGEGENPEPIPEARAGDPALEAMAGGSGVLGRGGMVTKLAAAGYAARSGAATVIASGHEKGVLGRLARGDSLGTLLVPGTGRMAARKQWLAGHLKPRGTLVLDDGAVGVLRNSGRSLLPVGVLSVSGDFRRGEMVRCVDGSGTAVASGLVNYDAGEVRRIQGQSSDRIGAILGYVDEPELIHRDNMVVL
ncbi:MAG: glutamate 5-kinase [Gammaproteobacteria bacterium]|nr:glutamate 5-kinase [Gammaproteobacteria bacterium]